MSLTLHVDGPRWRDHLRRTADAHPGIVPVAKGNGYGFTVAGLARRASWLGADMVAAGTYAEVDDIARRFGGAILVLEPWRPFRPSTTSPRVIHTIGRLEDLHALAKEATRAPRVVLEGLTSMHRHGLDEDDLRTALTRSRGVRVEGVALHLPLGTGHLDEIDRWLGAVPHDRWFVSHVDDGELTQLAERHPSRTFRPRIGTALWLGDRGALAPRSTVTDVHRVRRGERIGYRQRRAGKDGYVLVVSGGTAHGIALEAPASAASTRQRAVSLAKGGLEAAGRSLSPFVVAGKHRWFVEPPHMQVSLISLPHDVAPPAVGDEIDVQVRFTTTRFDRIEIS
jgi:hypothetical protein